MKGLPTMVGSMLRRQRIDLHPADRIFDQRSSTADRGCLTAAAHWRFWSVFVFLMVKKVLHHCLRTPAISRPIRFLESDVGLPTVGRSRCRCERLHVALAFGGLLSGDCGSDSNHALCKASKRPYIPSMRSRFIWLMPILLLLISVVGSTNAYAHSSQSALLESTAAEHQALDDGVQSDIQVSAASADESGAPCDCPGGHCTCNFDCLAMCATTAAIADTVVFDFSSTGSIITIEKMTFSANRIANRDFDPPRPIA